MVVCVCLCLHMCMRVCSGLVSRAKGLTEVVVMLFFSSFFGAFFLCGFSFFFILRGREGGIYIHISHVPNSIERHKLVMVRFIYQDA